MDFSELSKPKSASKRIFSAIKSVTSETKKASEALLEDVVVWNALSVINVYEEAGVSMDINKKQKILIDILMKDNDLKAESKVAAIIKACEEIGAPLDSKQESELRIGIRMAESGLSLSKEEIEKLLS